MSIEKNKNIMVYIESVDGAPINVSLEALAQAGKVAKETGKQVVAVLVGENLEAAAQQCVEFGADEVLCLEEARKEVEAIGEALASVTTSYEPSFLFLGSTLDGKDIGSIVASRAKLPCLTDVVGVKCEAGKCTMTLPMYSGNILKEVTIENCPAIVILRSGVCKKNAAEAGKAGNIQKEAAENKNLLTKILEVVQEISESVNLEEAEVIVAGGRGMGTKESFELVKQLAEVWIPRSHQIGQSGKIVAPKLYIACGISGATQHVSGVVGSDYIVAINKDEDAAIFDIADVGIVGNAVEILPIMIEEIKKIKLSMK